MTRVKSISDIGLVYETMQKNRVENAQAPQAEVVEEKVVKKLDTFPKATDKKVNVKKIIAKGSDKKAFFHKNSGPEAAEGFNKNVIEPKNSKKENHYEPQKFSTALEKNEQQNINNNMSKSIFDKLYEDVMKDDALDLGIQAGPEGEAGDAAADVGGESDEVTITLSRDLAQKLHDVLVGVLGGEGEGEDVGGEGEDLGGELKDEDEQHKDYDEDEQHKAKKDEDKEEEKDEDNQEVAKEAIVSEPAPKELSDSKGHSLTGKNNKVPGKLSHVSKSKASSAAPSTKVEPTPTALADSKGLSLTGKNNKVNAGGYKVGDFFK